jgi:hypothetical protein
VPLAQEHTGDLMRGGGHDKALRGRSARPWEERESGRARERVLRAQTCFPHTAMHKSSVKWLQLQRRISYDSDVYLAAAPPQSWHLISLFTQQG